VSQVVGFLKGKNAIQIARVYLGRRKNFSGQNFWVLGDILFLPWENVIRKTATYKEQGKRRSTSRSTPLVRGRTTFW
jgi:putative transposase